MTSFCSLLCKRRRVYVAVRLFSNWSQGTSKCGKNISDTLGYRLMCHSFVLTTFWRHLWSIADQTHGNMESLCKLDYTMSTLILPWFLVRVFPSQVYWVCRALWHSRGHSFWYFPPKKIKWQQHLYLNVCSPTCSIAIRLICYFTLISIK